MKIFITILLLSAFAFAQSGEDYTIIPNFKTGAGFGMFDVYTICDYTCEDYKVYPNTFVGFGLESGELINIYGMRMSLAFDAYYTVVSTKVIMTGDGRTQYSEKHLPIMFSAKFKTKGLVVPFIKTGIGIEWFKMGLMTEFSDRDTYYGEDWLLGFVIGGGIEINTIENLQISVFVDMMVKPHGLILSRGGRTRPINYDIRNSSTFAGVEIGYCI